jgi:hypothetical protein
MVIYRMFLILTIPSLGLVTKCPYLRNVGGSVVKEVK